MELGDYEGEEEGEEGPQDQGHRKRAVHRDDNNNDNTVLGILKLTIF